MDATEQKQKELFDKKADLFESHYSEKYTEEYRRRFIYGTMIKGLDLKGKKVLEAIRTRTP